ncbi:phage tail tape measure protein [Paraclostridium sordellii 8483]|uniref:phage tail tape measure protein n=1 Tax=Paraclostridium sordellii TaxID=1505 RepID=UPI0002FF6F23|nr:phage tail tape measure protein [Paeniclostridium sordellii]TAN66615.1 phage tail tape measure protein [Paeniclostridium sordellii 8483]
MSGKKEEIGELAIALSFESQDANKQISALNKFINRTEKEFKAAGKGVKNFENTYQGLDAKIKKTTKQLEYNNKKLKVQESEHKKVAKAFELSKKKLDEMDGSIDKNSKEWKEQANLVQKNADKLAKLSTDINVTKGNINKLTSELNESKTRFEELGRKTQTLDEKLEQIGTQSELTQSELNKLGSELQQSGGYFEKLGNEINKIANDLNTCNQKVDAYQSEINKLDSVLSENKNKHSQLKKEINDVEKELSEAKSKYGENSTEANQLNQKLLSLKDSYNQVETEIEQNNNELVQYKTQLNNVQTEVNQLSNELKQMPFDKVSESLKNTGSAVSSVGQSLTTGVTVPIGAAAGAATKFGVDFGSAMSKLQATSGITDKTSKSFVDLERKAREMGSTTSFSATDAANGLTYLALAGWDVETQIDRIEPVLRAAEAGGMDLARCADLVTDSMSAAGVASEDFSKYLDITAQAQRKSNTSMEQMLEAYTVAGGMFDQLNMPLEKSGALLGVLANRGTKGSEAGNALISVFSNLITETGQAGDALEAMGISLYDSTGKQRDMVDVLKEMAQKLGVTADGTSDLTEQQKQQYAAMVGGKTQFDTLMKLLSGVSGEYDTLEDQLKNSNGALAEMAKTMKDNLGGAIDNMKSALEGALIDAFKAMEPAIKSVVEKITDLSNWFNNLDEDSQRMIVTLAGVAAATGPLLIATGKLISAGGSVLSLFGKLSKSGGDTAKVIGLLKKGFSLLGGPLGIGAAVAAVGLAIYAFKKFDSHMKKDVIPSTESVVDGMKNVSEETKKTIKPFIEMSQTVETEFIKIKSNGTTMTEGLKNGVVSKLDEMVKEVKTKLESNRDNAEKTFNEMFANAVTITDQEKEQIINASKQAFNKKIEDVQASKDKINEILQTALNENRELNKAEENEIQDHYNNIKNTGLEIMSKSAEELKAIKKELNIHSKELSAQQASDVIQEAEKQRKGSIEKAQNEYQERLKYAEMLRSEGSAENEQLATKVISEANRMKEEQITAANKTADSVINSAKVQAGEYSKYIDSMTGKVLSGWEVMGNSVDNFVLKMWYGLIDFFNNIPENVQIFFGKIGISLAEFGISAIDWWRSLPFTDDKALEGVRQSWVQSIDETSKYVKDKTSEMDLEKPFRELPGKVRNSLENNNLTLSVMTDRYFLVKKVSTENIIEEYVRYGKFEVNFILEPFRYIKDERYIEISYSPIKLYYSGSYPGECNIKIYGRNNIQLTVNDETIQINNVDGYVELDSKLLLCLNRDKTSKTRDMIGNFPILSKGENIITWDGNITRVEILPRTAFK